mgnify:CR=1 FL=1
MLSSVPQPSPYKKMAKSYKRKDKKGIFPAGVDLSDSDSDYEFRESVAAKANNGQGNYLVAGLIGVIAIALFLLTRSSGNPVTTTVAPAERNIARDFIENSINTAPPVQQAPVVVSSPPVITPTTDVFEQLASVLRTIIFITIAGVAVYCYYISNSQGSLPSKVQGNFFSNKQNSQSTNQPFSKKERPGPLLPQLNWWEMFQPAAYPPSRLGNFGAALGGGLGGVVQGYMGLGQGQAMPGQPFFNRGYPYPNMANHRMPVHVNMHYDADDDEEYDSDDSDEDSDEGKVAYQEYLPAGMFDYRKEPNYFLNEKAKAQAREKAIAALSGKPAGAADTAEKKVVYSKSDLPEEFKPHYEPMPPVPGIDDPDPPISDTLVKNGPDKEKLQERVAKLAGGVAVIRVGAATEVEMKEKKARVEDALHATRAAVEEGVVAGGGVALLRAKQAIADLKGDTPDQNAGIKLILRAVEEPLRTIVTNAGEEASVVVSNVLNGKGNYGYNAATGEYTDLVEQGVLDPTKVTRTALQNAASVASLLLTAEAAVVELAEDKPAAPAMPGGMGGMGGMDF